MEIKGIITAVLEPTLVVKVDKSEAYKGSFVIKSQGQYPKLVAFETFGKTFDATKGYTVVGNEVEVSFDPESREYNGRYYTELKAWKVVVLNQATQEVEEEPAF